MVLDLFSDDFVNFFILLKYQLISFLTQLLNGSRTCDLTIAPNSASHHCITSITVWTAFVLWRRGGGCWEGGEGPQILTEQM